MGLAVIEHLEADRARAIGHLCPGGGDDLRVKARQEDVMMHVRHVLGFEHGDVFQALALFGVGLAQLAEERGSVPLGLL